MLQKSYSEGIFLDSAITQSSTNIKSTCRLNKERSYCTSVYFVPKLIPKRTYLTFNGSSKDAFATKTSATYSRACSLSNGSAKSFESSVSIEQDVLDGLECQQNVELVPGLVMKDFSESVNIFPKISDKVFRTRFDYDESYVKRNYIVGLEVQKVREVTLTDENSLFTSSLCITPETSKMVEVNGECDDSM